MLISQEVEVLFIRDCRYIPYRKKHMDPERLKESARATKEVAKATKKGLVVAEKVGGVSLHSKPAVNAGVISKESN